MLDKLKAALKKHARSLIAVGFAVGFGSAALSISTLAAGLVIGCAASVFAALKLYKGE